jgi:uncharacterized protein
VLALSIGSDGPQRPLTTSRQRPLWVRLNPLLRWLHIYTSMLSLLIVLFFAATGITLNHPEWVFGNETTTTEKSGPLPSGWQENTGKSNIKVNWLLVAESLRSQYGLRGHVKDYRNSDTEGSLSFAAPAYSADAVLDLNNGSYRLNISAQGWVAVLNDLHRGRDTGKAWSVLIDLSGWFLVVVAASGLGLLLYLKKVRLNAFIVGLVGTVLVLMLMRLAI